MHGVSAYRYLSSVLFILLTIGRSRGFAPVLYQLDSDFVESHSENSRNSTLTMSEGSEVSCSCIGDHAMDWRFPGRYESCFNYTEAGMITSTASRAAVDNSHSAGVHISTLTLTNVQWLDVGRVECYNRDQPELSDSFYLFVESPQHLLMPCMRPHWPVCLLPQTSYEPAITVDLVEREFIPCLATDRITAHTAVEIFDKIDGHRTLEKVIDETKGVLLKKHRQKELIVCRATNRATHYSEHCYFEVTYPSSNHNCEVTISINVSAPEYVTKPSTYVFASSNVTINCLAKCVNSYPGGFELNLTESSTGSVLKSVVDTSHLGKTELPGLEIHNVSVSSFLENVTAAQDNGFYQCRFSFRRPSQFFSLRSKKIPLVVGERRPLSFVFPNATTKFDRSIGEVELNCMAGGFPDANYIWYSGTTENPLGNESNWLLQRDTDSDGVYICLADNGYGEPIRRTFEIGSPMVDVSSSTYLILRLVIGFSLSFTLVFAFLTVFLYRKNRRVRLRSIFVQYFASVDDSLDGESLISSLVSSSMPETPLTVFLRVWYEKILCKNSSSSVSTATTTEGSISTFRDMQNRLTVKSDWVQNVADIPYMHSIYEVDLDRLYDFYPIGKGNFGLVCRAYLRFPRPSHVNSTGADRLTVAVKSVRDLFKTEQYASLSSEIKLLSSLGHHPNIVNLTGAVTRHLEKGILYMVLEFCEGGDLHSFLRIHRDRFSNTEDFDYFSLKQKHNINGAIPSPSSSVFSHSGCYSYVSVRPDSVGFRSEGESKAPLMEVDSDFHRDRLSAMDLLIFAYQIAKGMEFLHRQKVLHRDLAARNVLVAAGNVLKITDFGLAKPAEMYTQKSSTPVPFKWLALEALERHEYSRETDVWAFGVLLWEMFTLGDAPYPEVEKCDSEFINLLKADWRLPQPCFADARMYEMMSRKCWHNNPERRKTFSELKDELQQRLSEGVVDYYETIDCIPATVRAIFESLTTRG